MNPLSFSSRTGGSLSDLLYAALAQLGFSGEELGRLDQQATLAMQLQGLPDVMLSQLNDRLWIWSILPELSETRFSTRANEVLTVLWEPIADVEGGQLVLGRGDNGFELKGLVNLECLTQESGLLPVLTGFRERLDAICRVFD